MNDTPTRPALRYYGGKWNIAPWIISFFPAHRAYLEPCMGAASVFLRKEPAAVETLNDLNGRVVNFFKQLRDNTTELVRRVELTPWAEDEYQLCKEPVDDPVEDARRLYVVSQQSIHGFGQNDDGWRWIVDPARWKVESLITHDLIGVASRLRQAQITNRDAFDAIRRVVKTDTCLIYFDPPYTTEGRTHKRGYASFEVNDDWHGEAAELLRAHAGPVLVSGYASPLYATLYEAHGWQRIDRDFQGNSGSIRTESVWLSPKAHAIEVLPLFAGVTL